MTKQETKLEDFFTGWDSFLNPQEKPEMKVKTAIQEVETALLEYPHRNVLMTFETDSSDAPHMDIVRIVALQKEDDKTEQFYILDHQYTCIPHLYGHTDYCALNESTIGFREFDSKLNPEKIKDFIQREESQPNQVVRRPPHKIASQFGGSIEKTMGGQYYCSILPFLDNHLFSFTANGLGGTCYEPEIKRGASVGRMWEFIENKDSYDLIRKFIFNIRETYKPKDVYVRGSWQREQIYINQDDSNKNGA